MVIIGLLLPLIWNNRVAISIYQYYMIGISERMIVKKWNERVLLKI
jgi:hypothetical protein